jgi:alpha-N-arabinofuranosidase
MGKLRAGNGQKEPFKVKWWAIGNEMYGNWQLGNMPLAEYVKKHNNVVEAMRKVDPAIKVIGVGSVGKWSTQMLTSCADYMDLISEHFYCQERKDLTAHVAWIPNSVRRIAEAHRKYRQSIEGLAGKDVRIALDEWNYWYGPHVFGELGTRYFLKDGLGIAAGLHEYYRNSDIIFMANYAQTVNVIGCIKTSRTAAAFETTGLVLKLYRQQYGQIPIEVSGVPAPLDIAAAWTEDRKTLTIGIVNPTKEAMEVPVEIKGATLTAEGRYWQITGADEMVYNDPDQEPKVRIEEKPLMGFTNKLQVPPISVTLFSIKAK